MVYLQRLTIGKVPSIIWMCAFLVIFIAVAQSTKIAYKKPIYGKTNVIKEKRFKPQISDKTKLTTKSAVIIKTTTSTTTTTSSPIFHEELETAESTHSLKASLSAELTSINNNTLDTLEQSIPDYQLQNETSTEPNEVNLEIETTVATLNSNEIDAKIVSNHIATEKTDGEEEIKTTELPPAEESSTNTVDEPSNSTEVTVVETTAAKQIETTTAASKQPVPCTCGVFMTSQIKRTGNPYEPPIGRPVFVNDLDRHFPCNAIGQKQCQTKCLEMIVQHLPNSASILCASLDHDIRKERAYMFIKNCRNQWYNTNLAAGREYCCKNGQPYTCPMV